MVLEKYTLKSVYGISDFTVMWTFLYVKYKNIWNN